MADSQNNQPITLNPKEFAEMIVSSHQVSDTLDPEAIVKRKLTIYLTALMIAEKFNSLEKKNLDLNNVDHETYQKMIDQLSGNTFTDW
ncbi:hypothetical protein ACFQ5M_08185 [Agrilactobacillus yilanensis]|uniref:Phage gp6-like head-tail connector protein n=1 Tax=Agrilactobacillus yilanensis TaxID=2485997 RepID=A0ABW4J731_9LACO|nr:hypothetical protein [Agrilactobacillus yilanensis]